MNAYSLSHLSDAMLLRGLSTLLARDRAITAELLAHLAEIDARKLYLPAAYPSMYAYCVGELKLSEDSACKRIRAARAARRFPAIYQALAEGRLHLSAVVMLAPYLTEATARELLAAAAHKNKSEIEQLLAERFPQPDLPALVQPLPVPSSPAGDTGQLSPRTVEVQAAGPAEISAPGRIEIPATQPRVAPLAPHRFALQLTIDQTTHDLLRYAQALLSHQIPKNDVAEVLKRALEALIARLEKTKFAATERPRASQRRLTQVSGTSQRT